MSTDGTFWMAVGIINSAITKVRLSRLSDVKAAKGVKILQDAMKYISNEESNGRTQTT